MIKQPLTLHHITKKNVNDSCQLKYLMTTSLS